MNPVSERLAAPTDQRGSLPATAADTRLAADIEAALVRFRSGHWIDPAVGRPRAELDALASMVHPLARLAGLGQAWLMECTRPLAEVLDALTGQPDQIEMYARTWQAVADATHDAGAELRAAVEREVAGWTGTTADAYRDHTARQGAALETLAEAARAISEIVHGVGVVVASARRLVAELIDEFVSVLSVRLWQWLAEEATTLGLATPRVIAQVIALVREWVERITGVLDGLVNSQRRLRPTLAELNELVRALVDALRLLDRDKTLADVAEARGFLQTYFGDGIPDALALVLDKAIAKNDDLKSGLSAGGGIIYSKVLAVLGLKQALDEDLSGYERVQGAVDFLNGALGATAAAFKAGAVTDGAAAAVAGGIATAAGFVAIAGAALGTFAFIGAPVNEAVEQETELGKRLGYNVGFAAGAMESGPAWVKEKLDIYQQNLGGGVVEVARDDAFHKALWRGFDEADSLPPEAKAAYRDCVNRALVDERVWAGGTGEPYDRLVHAMARVTQDAQEACRSSVGQGSDH
jgi:uncharacterized protein YukE